MDENSAKQSDQFDAIIFDWNREKPELDTAAIGIVGRIMQLAKMLDKKRYENLKSFSIHPTDYNVLTSLRRSGNTFTLSPTEISETVNLTSGAMTASLNRLENRNFIARQSDSKDGRPFIKI